MHYRINVKSMMNQSEDIKIDKMFMKIISLCTLELLNFEFAS